MDSEYFKWAIGAVVVPVLAAMIALLSRKKKISQSQSQRATGNAHQKQSQSVEE